MALLTVLKRAATNTTIIPLAQAFVCCQCSVVLDTARLCPVCDSGQSIASLSAWLNRRSLQDALQAIGMSSAVMAAKESRG